MELRNKDAKIIIISGKARNGKDTVMSYLKSNYENIGKKVINLQYSTYIKDYAKRISNWDGSDETKPRELLQELGTEIIRNKIDKEFFIKRMIGDIKVYSYFFDVIIISDARIDIEIDMIKNQFNNVTSINVRRLNFDNGLTSIQKSHYTEIMLDNYNKFDYEIINDEGLSELEEKVNNIFNELRSEE